MVPKAASVRPKSILSWGRNQCFSENRAEQARFQNKFTPRVSSLYAVELTSEDFRTAAPEARNELAHPEGERMRAEKGGWRGKEIEPRKGGTKCPLFQSKFSAGLCAIFLILITVVSAHAQSAPSQPTPANSTFTDRDASVLLRQFSEALEARSQKKLLALFDFSQMKDAEIFRQQLNSLIERTDSIRVHLNLIETTSEPPGMTVDAEMETQTGDLSPASHKAERLGFTVARSGKAWKFIDLRPRSFFSLP
jgi:hypothetical protein